MNYPSTGNEVIVSFTLSNSILQGLGKSTITREPVSADYLKNLFSKYGVKIAIKPEHKKLLEKVNEAYDFGFEIPEHLNIPFISEKNRRLVIIGTEGLARKNGALLENYTDDEIAEASFNFVKYYVQSRHYDDVTKELEDLKNEYAMHRAWSERTGED